MIIWEIDPDLTKYNEVICANIKVMTTNMQKKPMWNEKIEKEMENKQGQSILTELQQCVWI